MRYIISNDLTHEVQVRQKYIYDSLHLSTFIQVTDEKNIVLVSIPSTSLDILFIVGHNRYVYNYLKENALKIVEKTIVAITCDGNMHFASLNMYGKKLYICHQNKYNYAELLDGSAYSFNFNITESELLLFNIRFKINIYERLDYCFTKLSYKGGKNH